MSVDGSAGSAYISWMPAEIGPTGTVPDYYLNATIPNGLQLDHDAEGRPPLQVEIEGLNEQAILNWWLQYKKNPHFNIVGRNCSTTVAKALQAGGAEMPSALAPRIVYEEAQQIQNLGPNWASSIGAVIWMNARIP